MAKDAKGHGSEARGGAAAHQGGVENLNKFQTRVGFYSLDQHNFGQETKPAIMQAHNDAPAAMKTLHAAINNNLGESKGDAKTYHIVTPTGERLSLNDAYRKTFNEDPSKGRKGFSYPKLGRAGRPGFHGLSYRENK